MSTRTTFTHGTKAKFKIGDEFIRDYLDLLHYYALFPKKGQLPELKSVRAAKIIIKERNILEIVMGTLEAKGYTIAMTNDSFTLFEGKKDEMFNKRVMRWEKAGIWGIVPVKGGEGYEGLLLQVDTYDINAMFISTAASVFMHEAKKPFHEMLEELAYYRDLKKQEAEGKEPPKPEKVVNEKGDIVDRVFTKEEKALEQSLFFNLIAVSKSIAGLVKVPEELEKLKQDVFNIMDEGRLGEQVLINHRGNEFEVILKDTIDGDKIYNIEHLRIRRKAQPKPKKKTLEELKAMLKNKKKRKSKKES